MDLRLPAYERTVGRGEVAQWYFRRRDVVEWYETFVARLASARGYVPLYRMSDGEFIFVCGRRPLPLSLLPRYPALVLKDQLRVLVRRHGGRFLSGTPGYGYETYTPEEWQRARIGYAERVRALARRGILAVNLVRQREFARQYIAPMCEWMTAHEIELTEDNYFPFYFVYAALLGADARRIYASRRVLIVTSDEDGTKLPAIGRRLERLGAACVEWIRISRSKAMFDRIELTGVGKVDLILIGAGVGALNIAEQVEPLGALTIDAGFVLDCLWRPAEFAGLRLFTRPDRPLPELQDYPPMLANGNFVALLAACAGLLTAAYSRRKTGTYLGPATYFWASWLLLIVCGRVAESARLMPVIPPRSWELVGEAFVGAFVGGLVGLRLSRKPALSASDGQAWQRFLDQCDWLDRTLTTPVVVITAVIGILNFVEAWRPVDFDPFRILEVRERYVSNPNPGWSFRISSYFSLLGMFLVMMFGAADAGRGVRTRRLAMMWLATVPGGLAAAGRGWTLAPLMIYGFSFLVCRKLPAKPRRFVQFVPLLGLCVAGLWAFTLIGSVRNLGVTKESVQSLEVANWQDEQSLMAAGWLGGSMLSVGVHGEYVEEIAPAYGEATFSFFALKAQQAGLIPESASKLARWDKWRVEWLPSQGEYGMAWCIPATAIPFLVFDYGRHLMPFALGVLLALMQWVGTRWAGKGIFKHTAAFLATYATFLSIQELSVFNTTNVVVLIWAAIVAMGARVVGFKGARRVEALT